ncbi:MAG: 3'(2'),5'-bisphosphate nucleotidase CysQ [Rhodospirillales bacterium]
MAEARPEAGGTAEDRDLLEVLRLFAERAGKAVLASFIEASSVLNLEQRPDGTPVTDADLASEDLLTEALSRLTPDVPVLSEERLLREGVALPLPPRYWLVDPLDGTDQFLSQNAEFSVNVALIEEGQPIAGVVHAPALAMTWAGAGPGSAAFSQTDQPPMAIAARTCPPEGGLLFLHRYQAHDASLAYAQRHYSIVKHYQSGGGLLFGFVATGQADFYAHLEPSYEWTSAAGQAILTAAGGGVVTGEGEPLRYGKPSFLNSGYVAHGKR